LFNLRQAKYTLEKGHLIDASCVTSQGIKTLFVREFSVFTVYDY